MSILTKKPTKTAATIKPTPKSEADLQAELAEIERAAQLERDRLRAELAAQKKAEELKAIAVPLDQLTSRLRAAIRRDVHNSPTGIAIGRIDSLWTSTQPLDGERYYLDEARHAVMKEIQTGRMMGMPSTDLGDRRYLVAMRVGTAFPRKVEPIAGVMQHFIARLWTHIAAGEKRVWTLSARDGRSVTDWKAATASIAKVAATGLIDVIDADGLLLISAGPLLRS